jgi:hypothetical protein
VHLPSRREAEKKAQGLASEREPSGYNTEHGFWWLRRDGRIFRFTVEAE